MRAHAALLVVAAGVVAAVAAAVNRPSAGIVLGAAPVRAADKDAAAAAVDVELVLAVDVSYSMDPDEQALQREGYITGLTSREFMAALRSGINGKVAATYFEWAG